MRQGGPAHQILSVVVRVGGDGTAEELTLIPYGCSNLRIAEFPVVGDSAGKAR